MQHDFYQDLSNENIDWFKPFFKVLFGTDKYQKTEKRKDIEGVDCYVNGKSIQCKLRNSFYDYDLCIEYKHEFSSGEKKRGWIWYKPKAEYLFYGWKECYRDKDNICLVMDFNKLHEYFKKYGNAYTPRPNKYPTKNGSKSWLTSNIYIPVNTLRKYMPIGHYSIPNKEKL